MTSKTDELSRGVMAGLHQEKVRGDRLKERAAAAAAMVAGKSAPPAPPGPVEGRADLSAGAVRAEGERPGRTVAMRVGISLDRQALAALEAMKLAEARAGRLAAASELVRAAILHLSRAADGDRRQALEEVRARAGKRSSGAR